MKHQPLDGFAPNAPSENDSEDEAEMSGDSSLSVKGPDASCFPVFCTAACCCHVSYIILFLAYMVIFPLWCKWLLTAPMPFNYWGQGYPDFPRMALRFTDAAITDNHGQPQIEISPIPESQSACNYSCSSELHGYMTSEMNFDVILKMNKPDLINISHTSYPIILTSEDFEHWMLAADRRHATPQVFFDRVSEGSGEDYVSAQDKCSKPAAQKFTDRRAYIIACISWRPIADEEEAAEPGEDWTKDMLAERCDVLGGVCGWPCNPEMPSTAVPNCVDGKIDQATLASLLGNKKVLGNVTVKGCMDASKTKCETSTQGIADWPCHECVITERDQRRRLQVPKMPKMPTLPPIGTDDEEGGGEGEDGDLGEQIYMSLPRMLVEYDHITLPEYDNLVSRPRARLFAANSVDGPWTALYDPVDPESDFNPPVPVGTEPPDAIFATTEDRVRSMEVVSSNKLTVTSESCFGKRGPLYVVACAVNQSSYDDGSQWQNSKDKRFSLGQKVMPPPFNDRCVAVSGRCGYACEEPRGSATKLPHCLPNGYIDMDALVGKIPIQYNRVTPTYMFVYVLLFGFAVKVIMLCPGIFRPYQRCPHYDPDLTEALKYILVVGVTGGGDEGKGTMVRNTIGMVAGLPPLCRCRFVVCNNEEGHRLEMLTCWERFCAVVAAMPNFGGTTYEENLKQFFMFWCEDTKTMKLDDVGAKVKKLDPSILNKISGRNTLARIKKDGNWNSFGVAALTKLEAAIEALAQDLDTNYNKFTPMTPHLDYVRDFVPPDPSSSLRMHFTSRAKPKEDERNIMVQHVAVGTWYYKVPPNASPSQWLQLRKNCQEMVYAQVDDDDITVKVPLRSSHGKAGGLNFVDNYITIVNDRPENRYGNDQDDAPSLYAIADARHQFQPDFFTSCVPCFFTVTGELNTKVAFTQAPQHYPEYQDKFDYLDNNNAQFFRLNAMIRNCCGGVSSCGTNGMWQISGERDRNTVWERRKKRVRDRDSRLRTELIEREQFHTSCKIEDTASSLDRVLVGEYSHFVNRKLSFGMSKSPEGFLGAQQRWVEGAITLCLQWITQNADAHGQAKRNGPLLWCVIFAFIGYVYALLRLVTVQTTSSIFVMMGLASEETYDLLVRKPLMPIIHMVFSILLATRGGRATNSYDYEVYEDMTLQFVVWVGTCVLVFLLLFAFTNLCKCFRRCILFPDEMKWWGRLLISFDNLTYWVWFWTSFFWIGFNVYLAVFPANFHFNNVGMMSFMLACTVLNYALIIANSMRFSIMESIDANEIAFLSMDNIWRANQLFFMVGPIQGFSVYTGVKNFINYLFYGQDIGGWSGGDLTQVSIAIVKTWTTMIIFMAIGCWIYLFVSHPSDVEYQSRRPGCIVFTFIAMDVLHPCVYLWTVGNKLTDQDVAKMTVFQRLTSSAWWKKRLATAILNETTTNVFKFVAPIYNFMLPILVFYNAYFGVSGGFTLVAVGAGH